MTRIAFPFLTLSDSAVTATSWMVSLNGAEWVPVSDYLKDWDPSSIIHVRRQVAINMPVASEDLKFDISNIRISASVSIGTGQGRLPRFILDRKVLLLDEGSWIAQFQFEVPGAVLSIVLDLCTRITLAENIVASPPLSPSRVGDLLWSDRFRMRLEGEEPRFPIEVGDIQALLGSTIAASAPWYLYWSPREWSRDFHGAMRLYLNAAHTEFIERIEEEDPMIIQILMADVINQVCERLIMEPELNDLFNSAEPGSLAAQASSWLKKAWPGKEPEFIRSIFESRPGVFRASLLSLADLGDK